MKFEKKARAYALKNAMAHEGVAFLGPVLSGLFNEGLKKDEVKKYIKDITEIVEGVNELSPEEQVKEFNKLKKFVSERETRDGLPELPNARHGKVVMRFAPSASGPLHVGHALTASLSYLFVKEHGGKFHIRIEDTNPENVYDKAYKMISEDSKWLFPGKFVSVSVQSDRMEIYYKYAEKLIKKDFAYVCTCSQSRFKVFVDGKKKCPCRKLKIKENLESWNKMVGRDKMLFNEGVAVLRFKGKAGMDHKNPAMRDFPLARINLKSHPRQKNKYRVWPLMNLAVSVDDIEMGMTHIVRAKDHRDNALRQEMIYEALGLKKKVPWTAFLGRIKFKDMELSTTKIKQAIKVGKYSGWNDKRLPTVVSLRKQDYKPSAFWKFAERIGLSENDKVIDREEFFTLLDSFKET